MTSNDYWNSAYKNRDFEHWELNYPSPELAALVAARSARAIYDLSYIRSK